MFNSNIFKFLSLSLLMCPMVGSAMEPLYDAPESMLLSIANQSEQTIYAFIPTMGADPLYKSTLVSSFEDKDSVIRKNSEIVLNTQLGMFTLYPDRLSQPTFLILSHQTMGPEGQAIITQIPYHEVNNIVMIVNPDGSVLLAQGDSAYALEKMNGIQRNNVNQQNDVQVVKVPRASIGKCDLDTKIRRFHNSSHVEYYCKASILFDQESNQQFMNNFIEFLKQHLPKPINHGGTRNTIPIQITGSGASIYIRAPLLLSREFLQCIIDYANEHFAHQ